ncbi:MAG: hypothetical protein WC666_04120 [Candidatus Paceibacterota bacterium]|jgi:cell division protein FtsB
MRYGNHPLWKRFFSSFPVLIGVFVLSVVLVKATWNMLDKSSATYSKLSQVQTELDKLKMRERDLANQINYLSTEQGVEAELRTKFRAVKDGESVAVILESPKMSASSTQSASVIVAPIVNQSWWQRMLSYIGL